MPMKEEHRQRLLITSREAAAAFLEDVRFLREVTQKAGHSKKELLHLACMVRRIVVDDDLTPVAGPRLGRFRFDVPNIKPAVKANNAKGFHFFASAAISIPGLAIGSLQMDVGQRANPVAYNPDQLVQVRPDGFMAQAVICLNGDWLTRRNAVKYAANFASGVHSKHPTERGEELALRIYRCVNVVAGDNGIDVHFNMDGLHSVELPPFVYNPSAVNPILLELLATIQYITSSSDTARLEQIIANELRS